MYKAVLVVTLLANAVCGRSAIINRPNFNSVKTLELEAANDRVKETRKDQVSDLLNKDEDFDYNEYEEEDWRSVRGSNEDDEQVKKREARSFSYEHGSYEDYSPEYHHDHEHYHDYHDPHCHHDHHDDHDHYHDYHDYHDPHYPHYHHDDHGHHDHHGHHDDQDKQDRHDDQDKQDRPDDQDKQDRPDDQANPDLPDPDQRPDSNSGGQEVPTWEEAEKPSPDESRVEPTTPRIESSTEEVSIDRRFNMAQKLRRSKRMAWNIMRSSNEFEDYVQPVKMIWKWDDQTPDLVAPKNDLFNYYKQQKNNDDSNNPVPPVINVRGPCKFAWERRDSRGICRPLLK